jgi:putative transposase
VTWTVERPRAADRRGLHCPSDLMDSEWALEAPLIRSAKHGGRLRKVDVREVPNATFEVLSAGSQWQALPSKNRRGTTSRAWTGKAPSSAFTTRSTSRSASRQGVRPARRRRSSTARQRRQRKRGLYARPVRLRRGQEGRRPQAPLADRYHCMLLAVTVHPANVQDRDGAEPMMRQSRRLFALAERIIGWISPKRVLPET